MTTRVSLHRLLGVAPAVLLAIMFCINPAVPPTFAEEATATEAEKSVESPAWLEGTGKDLRIRLSGEVVGEDGAPAEGFRLEVLSRTDFGEKGLPVEIRRNRFSCWVPVGKSVPFCLRVNATSSDGRLVARPMLYRHEIRQAAVDGLVLDMRPAERSVEVTVLKNDKPLPGAFVSAMLAGFFVDNQVTGKTNDAGVATFGVIEGEKLSGLTAWTEDFMVGGCTFPRDPSCPTTNRHTVELHSCRPQRVRIIDVETGAPVPGLAFRLSIGAAPPSNRFVQKTPECELTTDEDGEAVDRWFPDWERFSSYIKIQDPRWTEVEKEVADGVIVVRVKKNRVADRKRVVGRVESEDASTSGLLVMMHCKKRNRPDSLAAFTDSDGRFAVEYLPGVPYCVFVNDSRFVSDVIGLIPFEPETEEVTAPVLTLSRGHPVDIVATAGPRKRPLAFQRIGFHTEHRFSWREAGNTHHSRGLRGWSAVTDAQGRVRTFAPDGQVLSVGMVTPDWTLSQSAQVKTDGVTRITLHRAVDAKRKVIGRLMLPENLEADLNEASVEIGSVDGETRERFSLKADPDGEFVFESQASCIGIYARTKDAKAAAVALVDNLDEPVVIELLPTAEYHGQVLGEENVPLADRGVQASLSVSGKEDSENPLLPPKRFSAATFKTKTDNEGKYSFAGLPYRGELSIRTAPTSDSDYGRSLDRVYLIPGESRPLAVSRLWKPKTKTSFAERYKNTLRDCRISDFHLMIALLRPSDEGKQFIEAHLKDYERTPEVMSFMQLRGTLNDGPSGREIAEFAKSKNWPTPGEGKVLAFALDATGKELGRAQFDYKSADSHKQAAEFIRKYAPEQVDAKKKWDEAFAKAKETDRKVWARISGRYCGPCFRLSRWLDDRKETLEKDYVFLKIGGRELHGAEVTERITRGEHHGIPFFAIFDPDGTMLIDSAGSLGNIGHPSGFEGKRHLRKMLMETRKNLTPEQIDDVVGTLGD